jgi:antirestriction protein
MEIANARKNESNPRIYVACLSAYNAGILHGAWVDANQDPEDIHQEIQEMLAESPEPSPEEWALHDFEHFGSFHLAEYDDIETVSALARLIDEFGEMVASTVWGHVAGDADEARRLLEECYQGAWDSLEAWAEDLLESTGELDQVPEHLRPYIDVEAYARDLELNGDVFTVEDGISIHVFWGR